MIKIQNNTNVETGVSTITPTREALPVFLQGLAPESLLDLSWTDPALGVRETKWLPEELDLPVLKPDEKYGDEIFTVKPDKVIVSRTILKLTEEELVEKRKAITPKSITMRQAKLILNSKGLLDSVNSLVSTDKATQIEWEYSSEVKRDWPAISLMSSKLGISSEQLDFLFIEGSKL